MRAAMFPGRSRHTKRTEPPRRRTSAARVRQRMTWPDPSRTLLSARNTNEIFGEGVSLPATLQQLEDELGALPVFLVVDVLHAIAWQHTHARLLREQRTLLEPGFAAPPVELTGVVKRRLQILGARHAMLGPEHL